MKLGLASLPQLWALSKEANGLWEQLDGNDRDKLDEVFKRAITLLPLPEQFSDVKGYLATGKDPLPARIAGAMMHPSVRGVTLDSLRATYASEHSHEETGIFICPHCEEPTALD